MGIKDLKTQEEFDREAGTGENKFLLFYSAWDPFCVEFMPAAEKLAANSPIPFFKVSIDALPLAADLFAVEGVPAVLFFRNGKTELRLDADPEKGLTAEKLAEFVWRCRGSANKK